MNKSENSMDFPQVHPLLLSLIPTSLIIYKFVALIFKNMNTKQKMKMKKLSITLMMGLICGITYGQENNFKQYLANNQENIDLEGTDSWKILKQDAEKNQLIILGESHGAQNAQLIDFNLLKYLNKTVGTKKYIAELDYAQAEKINDYLKTGNEKPLKEVFKFLVSIHAQWGNQDFYNKIVKIRSLNQTLTKDKKIKFIGIDVVQDHSGYLKFIQKLTKNQKNPLLDSLNLMINKSYDPANVDEISSFAKNYSKKINQNKTAFKTMLKSEFSLFKYLITNLSYGDKSVGVNRPEGIYQNFTQLSNILNFGNQKMYGMWGFFHAHLVPFKYIGGDFVSKLSDSENPIAKKITSIICLPIDSKYNVWDSKTNEWKAMPFSYDDKSLFLVDGIEDLKELSTPYSTTLFKLNSKDSPFLKSGRLLNGTAPRGKLVADFKNSDYGNQYIILMRNSDWLNPLPKDF